MPLNASQIAAFASKEKQLNDAIHRTFPFRDCGKKKRFQEWSDACEAWHSYQSPLEKFWSDEFKSLVQSGDRSAINELITYLEVDPYYFRSGYLKGRLARIIKGSPRAIEDDRRLRGVIWNRAGGHGRQEFREYCRLATRISTPSFRDAVAKKAKLFNGRNFKMLLTYLPKRDQATLPSN
jgi:hypothetical protein